MTAYTPSFLFDFTFFYAFSGFDNTQLLFIGMIVLLTNLYFHISLSKKHLLYSFPLTLILLGGIGLRVATSAISLDYIFHYLIFSTLLFVIIIDHKLYLFIPEEYKTPLGKTKMRIEKVSLPAFNTVHPKPTRTKQGISSIPASFSQNFQELKNNLRSKLGIGQPQPTSDMGKSRGQSASLTQDHISTDEILDEKQFIHPIEKSAEDIETTKEMLSNLGSQSLDHLDSKINNTKLGDHSFLDSFFSSSAQLKDFTRTQLSSDFSSLLDHIEDSAVIISRGVVKAANTTFASMVDQPIGDIVNKDFIDFLAPEGFASFKSHCSKRLSGASSQTFRVVLLSKKHEKIPLQATIKSTKMNGEPVEITVFQKMNT
ncbi:MAG: hypothetical protein KGY50_05170 [Candidatus Thermoplasmatota archaeon]|nr:hypothetical protein [Candidatus Thermoplasmatota archaeon]